MKRAILSLSLVFSLTSVATAAEFALNSKDLSAGKDVSQEFVFNGFGCTGKNQSPELQWSGAPVGTQSFAVSIYDPDAPTGSGWWHWYLVNIPPTTTSLARGIGTTNGEKLPPGAGQIHTDFGQMGYGGPCPPAGAKPHRYIVTVYALKVPTVDVPDNATAALAGFLVNSNAIAKATLTFTYGR